MVIIAEFRINNGTDLARSGCNLDSFAKKTAITFFFRSYASSVGNRPENTGHYYDFNPIQQNQLRLSHDCNPTRQNRFSFPECYGMHLTVGGA